MTPNSSTAFDHPSASGGSSVSLLSSAQYLDYNNANIKMEPQRDANSGIASQSGAPATGSTATSSNTPLYFNMKSDSPLSMSLTPSRSPESFSGSLSVQPIPRKSAIIKTDKPRPHMCPTCTRAFARLEHLRRHERSHTNEKPFQCGACGRCFARRDLVLRHQQKLHTLLPSQNRTRTRKHNFDQDAEPGNITQDYINEHINIVYKNTNLRLPLPNGAQPVDDGDDMDDVGLAAMTDTENNKKRRKKSASPPATAPPNGLTTTRKPYTKRKQQKKKDQEATTNIPPLSYNMSASSSLDVSPQVMGSLFSGPQGQQQPQQQQPSPITSNTSPPDKALRYQSQNQQTDDLVNSIFQDTPLSFTSQSMYHSVSEQPVDSLARQQQTQADQVDQHDVDPSHFRLRHSSFSAASLSSYTLVKDAESIQKHDIPEAPHQVGFATPQLSAQELSDRAALAGFDLDALGIDPAGFPSTDLDAKDKQLSSEQAYFDRQPHASNSKNLGSTPFEFNITPGGSLIDLPLLQQYLHVGGAGGGAGFDTNGSNLKSRTNSTAAGGNIKEEDWLTEFINTPFDINFPMASHHIGFSDSPPNRNSPFTFSDDIPSLFRSRQLDLSKQINDTKDSTQDSKLEFFNNNMRNKILLRNHLQSNQFPLLEDLNKYISLYEVEFDKYFPFIHFATLREHHEDEHHLPLLLAMASIGALYSFHANNSTILAHLSRYLIHNYMSKQKSFKKFNDIPLPITQGLILDIYLGMFGNEVEFSKVIRKHLHSVICLVKSTKLNIALEKFVTPPAVYNNGENVEVPNQLRLNYEYFVLLQSRIRTLHTLYYISVLFASLVGNDIELSASDIQNGTPCHLEELWKLTNEKEWLEVLQTRRMTIDSKFSLIQISNGEPMNEIIDELENHYSPRNLGFKTMLSALMSISERIYKERTEIQQESNLTLKLTKWRMNSRPVIESLLKSWESIFVKNGGILVPRLANSHVITQTPVLKLILPLLSFAKIRKCVYFTPILRNIWTKNWNQMHKELKFLDADPELLRDATNYSLDIVNLWIEVISISKDLEKTSVRTPIFFLTCIFSAILVIGEYLHATETWARYYLSTLLNSPLSHISPSPLSTSSPLNTMGTPPTIPTLNAIDRVLWLKLQDLMKRVEKNLSGPSNLDLNDDITRVVMEPTIDLKHALEVINMAKLSSKSLQLGVRILADAPVWPVALIFAEALETRSNFIKQEQGNI